MIACVMLILSSPTFRMVMRSNTTSRENTKMLCMATFAKKMTPQSVAKQFLEGSVII